MVRRGAIYTIPSSAAIQSQHGRRARRRSNTPLAIATLHEMAADVNRSGEAEQAAKLVASGNLMGLLQHDPGRLVQMAPRRQRRGLGDAEINALIDERGQARASKKLRPIR